MSLRALCAIALALSSARNRAGAHARGQLPARPALRRAQALRGQPEVLGRAIRQRRASTALELPDGPEARFAKSYASAAAKGRRSAVASCGLKLRVEALLGRAVQDVDPLTTDLAVGFRRPMPDDAKLRAKLEKARPRPSRARVRDRDQARREARRRRAAAPTTPRRARSWRAPSRRRSPRRHKNGVIYAGPDADETADRVARRSRRSGSALHGRTAPSHTISGTSSPRSRRSWTPT